MAISHSNVQPLELPLRDALLCDYVRKHAYETPDQVAIIYYGREISYKELDESSDGMANALDDMGYRKSDRLGIFLQPCPQCYILYLAAIKLGMIVVPIDPMSKQRELEYFVNDSGARVIATMDQTYEIVKSVKRDCGIKDIIVTSFHDYLPETPDIDIHPMMRPERQIFSDTHEFTELIKTCGKDSRRAVVNLSDYGYIFYTGGTTGWPKGCVHSQHDIILSGVGQSELNYNKATKEDKVFSSWPLTHISGITMALAPGLVTGMSVVQLTRWDPLAAMQAIAKYGVTIAAMAVPSYYDVINHPEVARYDLSSLRVSLAVPFAMPITNDIVEKWEKLTGCVLYDWGYGSSEHMNYCGYGHGLSFPRPICSTSSRPFPGVRIKIVDFKTRKELPEGEEGEIVAKQPAQLKEYWNKPQETEQSIVDGWVHMNDRGYVKDGVLYFMGKASEVIKVSGYTVALKEIETFGMEHPEVARIAVIGVADPRKGNRLKAFIVLRPGAKTTASEIEEWFKTRVASYKCPIVELRADLPTSGKGEILKRELIKGEERQGEVGEADRSICKSK